MNDRVRQGWRWFSCGYADGCGRQWKETCRDAASPSGENCTCGEFIPPDKSEVDPAVTVDTWGNLVKFELAELVPPHEKP